MPELPEVETIARDLRGLVTGARIVDASSNWPPTLRSHEQAAFAAAIHGREIEGVGRRGKQLLVWLGPAETPAAGGGRTPAASDPTAPESAAPELAVLTVHLKM